MTSWTAKIKFGAQGTHVRIPIDYMRFKEALEKAREDKWTIYGVEIDPDAEAVDENPFHDDKIMFIFGNEGEGLSEKARKNCDRFVRIKQFAPKTESLNVSVAAGIVLHQW